MVGEENIGELPNLVTDIPEIITQAGTLINILKAVGVIAVIYFLIVIINSFINYRRISRLKKIEEKIIHIDKKLDKVLKNGKK